MVSNTIIASSWVPGTSGQIELAVKLRPQLQEKKKKCTLLFEQDAFHVGYLLLR